MVRRSRRKAEAAAEAERGKAKRARSSSRKAGDGAEKKPRVAGGGLTQQVRPDAALGAVIGGTEPRTRAEITKQVWDYIKSKGLQDAENRRSINADAKLRAVFGKDQVTMFELPRAIGNHVEKV
jgi:DNA topoisomerase-3